MWRDGTWMDPDLNKYDLTHRVTHHQKMSDEEWDRVLNVTLTSVMRATRTAELFGSTVQPPPDSPSLPADRDTTVPVGPVRR